MGRHYYRTNIPFPVMLIWWVFLGICVVMYSCYDAVFNAPTRRAQQQAQAQWDHDHFNGWRLEQGYDTEHGLLYDKLDKKTCTTKGYPGYPACPLQQYFLDGSPHSPPENPDTNSRYQKKSSKDARK